MSSKIHDLHPVLQKLAQKHIDECAKVGIKLSVYCTYRSIEEQNSLYAKGRTKPGPKVTNARGGRSFHNYRVAYDAGPEVDGKIAWSREDLFNKIGEVGEKIGLEWGGRFKTIKDLPHFQFTRGLSINDFAAGKTLPDMEDLA